MHPNLISYPISRLMAMLILVINTWLSDEKVRQRYHLALVRMVGAHNYGNYITNTHPFNGTIFPCHTLFEVDVYDSCRGILALGLTSVHCYSCQYIPLH